MIDKLEYLMALASERHFARAAEACGVTQPTLSAGVKQLEEALGVMLVQRSSRFIGLTPEGERTLDWARRIVSDSRSMKQEINALKHGLTGPLRLAAIPATLPLLTELTTPFHIRHPNVQFTVLSKPGHEILTLLDNHEIDAGIVYIDVEPLGRVNAMSLYRERYRLLTSADAPYGDRDKVTWGEVAKVPLCLLTPDTVNRRLIERLLRDAGGDPHIALESNSITVLFTHVRSGRWSSIMPEKLAHALGLTDMLRAIPIVEPEAVHTIGMVVPAREPNTPMTTALLAEGRRFAARYPD